MVEQGIVAGALRHLDLRSDRLRLVFRFVGAGVLNTVFGYACFAALILLHVPDWLALTLTMIAGILFNYQTSRRLVFRSTGHLTRFLLLYGLILVANWAALRGLTSLNVPVLAAQALLAIPIAALSFVGQLTFVFGRR